MSNDVYANGNAIACKAGDDKVIAAMPDVCLSPPSPPAGPIPVPYPNTSFSKDMQNGSKTVQINGKEVMLKDQSFYKTSPLGDEAATNSFGGSVITHVITGKTYFSAWSMDVKFEDANVDRHLDLTTSNHASYPGSTGPMAAQEAKALTRLGYEACPCCGSQNCTAALPSDHPGLADASGAPVPRENHSFREWYRLDEPGNIRAGELATVSCEGGRCPNSGRAPDDRKSNPPCDVYRVTSPGPAGEGRTNVNGISQARKRELRALNDVPLGADDVPLASQQDRDAAVQIDHRTPRTAGGCPTSENNTVANANLCENCKAADDLLDGWSNDELTARRAALGL